MKRSVHWLWLLLTLSAALSFAYAHATPLGASPDESPHLEFVHFLVTHGRLPALDLSRPRDLQKDVNYESHQPPLYYALAVPFYGAGQAFGGKQGPGMGCRVLSILLGLAGTALVWLLAAEVAPERPALWIAATGIAAFLPMRLSINSSVSNDALAELTAGISLLLMLRAVRGPWDYRPAAFLGIALGAALLTKQNAILLLPPALLAIFLACRGTGPLPVDTMSGVTAAKTPAHDPAAIARFLRTGSVVLGVTVLLSGWWFVRNRQLYGDPLAQGAFNRYFQDTPLAQDLQDASNYSRLEYFQRLVLPTTFESFWGAFGHLDPRHPELFMGVARLQPGERRSYPPTSWIYAALATATAAACAVGGWYVIRRRFAGITPGPRNDAIVLLSLHGLFVLAAFLNFNTHYFQAQGRYLFPAIGVLSLGLAGGWLEFGRRRQAAMTFTIVTAVLVLAGYALFGVLIPGFSGG